MQLQLVFVCFDTLKTHWFVKLVSHLSRLSCLCDELWVHSTRTARLCLFQTMSSTKWRHSGTNWRAPRSASFLLRRWRGVERHWTCSLRLRNVHVKRKWWPIRLPVSRNAFKSQAPSKCPLPSKPYNFPPRPQHLPPPMIKTQHSYRMFLFDCVTSLLYSDVTRDAAYYDILSGSRLFMAL